MPRIYKRLLDEERKTRRSATLKKATLKWRAAHPEQYKAINRVRTRRATLKWRARDPEGYKKSKAKSDAKYRQAHPELVKKHKFKRYGLTVDEYNAMVLAQNDCCAICSTREPGKGFKYWCIDHCHETNAVRKLLCRKCNIGLGFFKHNPVLLQAAIDYLKEFS